MYSVQYDDGNDSEFDRLMDLWNDTEYVHNYFEENLKSLTTQYWSNMNWRRVRNSIPDHANNLEDLIYDISESNNSEETLDDFFVPLDDFDPHRELYQLSKGKNSDNPKCLRIYAIRIGIGCYVITGGAIKLTERMQDHKDTAFELTKLRMVQDYLREKFG